MKKANFKKKLSAALITVLLVLSVLYIPVAYTVPGGPELTANLIYGSTTYSGSTGRTVVNNHEYVAAVFGTGGWTPYGSYSFNNLDYRAAFDTAYFDALPGTAAPAKYFDGAKLGYAGIEFKTPQVVAQIGYLGRKGYSGNRLDGAYFQGSNDGVNYTTLYVLNGSNQYNFTYRTTSDGLNATRAYKYFRITGHYGMCDVLNITELRLYSSPFAGYGVQKYRVEPPATSVNVRDKFTTVRNAGFDPSYANILKLTEESEANSGAVWAKQKVDLTKPFSIESYIHLHHKHGFVTNSEKSNYNNGGLADGVTFTLQNDPICQGYAPSGALSGGLLGVYGGAQRLGFVKNALSVELDTHVNLTADITGVLDPRNGALSHIAVVTPKNEKIVVADHKNVDYFQPIAKWYPFNVTWTPCGAGGILQYSFDGRTYSYNVSNCYTQFGGTSVYWGFTGATGWGSGMQSVAIKTMPNQNPTYPITVNYYTDSISPSNRIASIPLPAAAVGTFITGVDAYRFAPTGYITPGAISGDTVVMARENVVNVLYTKPAPPPRYTINYYANGGTGTMMPDSVDAGNYYAIKDSVFSRFSYVFLRWNTQPDGSGTYYTAYQIINVTGNLNLYAQWLYLQ